MRAITLIKGIHNTKTANKFFNSNDYRKITEKFTIADNTGTRHTTERHVYENLKNRTHTHPTQQNVRAAIFENINSISEKYNAAYDDWYNINKMGDIPITSDKKDWVKFSKVVYNIVNLLKKTPAKIELDDNAQPTIINKKDYTTKQLQFLLNFAEIGFERGTGTFSDPGGEYIAVLEIPLLFSFGIADVDYSATEFADLPQREGKKNCVTQLYDSRFSGAASKLFDAVFKEFSQEKNKTGLTQHDDKKLQLALCDELNQGIERIYKDLDGDKFATVRAGQKYKTQNKITSYVYNNHASAENPLRGNNQKNNINQEIHEYPNTMELVNSIVNFENPDVCNAYFDANHEIIGWISPGHLHVLKHEKINRTLPENNTVLSINAYNMRKLTMRKLKDNHQHKNYYSTQARKVLRGRIYTDSEFPHKENDLQRIDINSAYSTYYNCEYAPDDSIPDVPTCEIYACDNSILEQNEGVIHGLCFVRNIIPHFNIFKNGPRESDPENLRNTKNMLSLNNGIMTMTEARFWHENGSIEVYAVILEHTQTDQLRDFLTTLPKIEKVSLIGKFLSTKHDESRIYNNYEEAKYYLDKYISQGKKSELFTLYKYNNDNDDDNNDGFNVSCEDEFGGTWSKNYPTYEAAENKKMKLESDGFINIKIIENHPKKFVVTVENDRIDIGPYQHIHNFIIGCTRVRVFQKLDYLINTCNATILDIHTDSITFISKEVCLINPNNKHTKFLLDGWKDAFINTPVLLRKIWHQWTMTDQDYAKYELTDSEINSLPKYEPFLNRRLISIEGPAGSGKSFTVNKFFKNALICAPTAIALSVYGKNVAKYTIDKILTLSNDISVAKKLFSKYQTLVIDECSMLTMEKCNKLITLFREIHNNKLLFGGIQLVIVGDPYQLEPVDTGYNIYARKQTYLNLFGKVIELSENHRQKEDPEFANALNGIRQAIKFGNPTTYKTNINKIVNMCKKVKKSDLVFDKNNRYICKTNATKDNINNTIIKSLKSSDEIPIIIRKNKGKFINGQKGTLVNDTISVVDFDTNEKIETDKNNVEYQPGYAMTSYISQGQTITDSIYVYLDEITSDWRGAYVCLSRAKNSNQITIIN